MATTLLGPLLPLLASRWAMSDASAGALFSAQFAGQLTATTLSTLVTSRLGGARTLAMGFLLVALGVGAVGVVPASLGWVAVLVYGLGLGCVLPVTNNLVASLAPTRAVSALSLVNVSWGVGAMVWPLVVAASTHVHPAGATLVLAAASAMAGVAWMVRTADATGAAGAFDQRAVDATGAAPATLVATYATLILLYVGSETAISGWVAAFARRMGTGQGAWAYAPTAFWTAQTAGRLMAPLVLRRIGEAPLMLSSLATSVVAVLVLSTAASVSGVIAAAALAGLAVAAIFPLLWAGVTRHVAPTRPAAVGPLFAAGGVGGAVLPWLVGVVSSGQGLRTGLLVPLAALVLMLVVTVPGTVRNVRGPRTTSHS